MTTPPAKWGRPMLGPGDYVREITDEFCSTFGGDGAFSDWFACIVAAGELPKAVDPDDPRVKEIVRRCREGAKPC